VKCRVRVISKMFNEASFVETFIRHYTMHGADDVILFDDGCTDDSSAKAALLGATVLRFESQDRSYNRESDERRCQEVFSFALRATDGPTWWLFPDVDELIQPGPGLPRSLHDALCSLHNVDGVPCVGIHCLPRVPEDERFELPSADLVQVLNQVAPPRSIERSHKAGAAWKTPIWFFGADSTVRYGGLRLSSGSHLLLGDSSHLRYAKPAWPLFHYKVRRVATYLSRVKQVLERVSDDDHYRTIWEPSHDRVAAWASHQFRILRVAPVLSDTAINEACVSVREPGVYLESPFRPGVWARE